MLETHWCQQLCVCTVKWLQPKKNVHERSNVPQHVLLSTYICGTFRVHSLSHRSSGPAVEMPLPHGTCQAHDGTVKQMFWSPTHQLKWQQEIKTQCCFIPNILNWQMPACLRKLEMVKAFSYYTNKLHWMGNIWGWCCCQDVELHYQVCVSAGVPPQCRGLQRDAVCCLQWQAFNGGKLLQMDNVSRRSGVSLRHGAHIIIPEYMLFSICQP